MERIKKILDNYTKEDYKLVHDTVDELCSKGISKGCFQDYNILADIVAILSYCENIIKEM